jgi:hypothetical protein
MDKAFKDFADKSKVFKAQGEQRKAYLRRLEDLAIDPVRVDKGSDNVMTSAYTQSLRDNANLLVMTKDARSLKPADKKISGDKQESATGGMNEASSSSQQVDYSDDGWYNEPGPPIVTREQRDKSLKLWKDALIHSGKYLPKQNLSVDEHDTNIRFLMAAMRKFRDGNIKGMRAHKWDQGQSSPLQKKLFIPRIYCPVEQYFDQVVKFPDAVYNIRCCPLYDYYKILCKDTPGYVSNIRPPMRYGGDKVQSNPRDYRPPRANQGFFPKSSVHTAGDKTVPALNPSSLDTEQIESADKAHRRREAPKKNAPIPEDEDSTGTDSETTKDLFEDKCFQRIKLRLCG